jgi:hypothetical protein
MIGQILSNNNKRCYINFSLTFREVNTPLNAATWPCRFRQCTDRHSYRQEANQWKLILHPSMTLKLLCLLVALHLQISSIATSHVLPKQHDKLRDATLGSTWTSCTGSRSAARSPQSRVTSSAVSTICDGFRLEWPTVRDCLAPTRAG